MESIPSRMYEETTCWLVWEQALGAKLTVRLVNLAERLWIAVTICLHLLFLDYPLLPTSIYCSHDDIGPSIQN